MIQKRDDLLSPREAEILGLLEQGLPQKEVADRLEISFHTVRSHLHRIFVKTKTLSTLAAIYQMRLRYGLPPLSFCGRGISTRPRSRQASKHLG